MARHLLLNNIDHKNLKVITRKSEKFGDNIMCAPLFLGEFREAQADYPIFFYKDPHTGCFCPMAIFGLQKDENLFLNEAGWKDAYIPYMVEKGPFLIGKKATHDGKEELIISIDVDDPRVNSNEGEAVFLEFGGCSKFTLHISSMLKKIHLQRKETELFSKTMDDLQLLEPFTMEFQLDSNKNHSLSGFYIINEEKLSALSGNLLAELSQRYYLHAAFMIVASLTNVQKLVDKKCMKHNKSDTIAA